MITTADKVINLIFLKYLKAKITYEHDRRVETYQFAREAIREAVYNAIAHNCYMFGTPIQIRIEDEEMIISNRSILPDGWTAETLMEPHDSIPYNPDIANVFYRMGYIETWGRGVQKICDECRTLGAELPKYEVLGNSIRLYFKALQSALIDPPKAPKHQSPPIDGALESEIVRGLIEIIREEPNISQEVIIPVRQSRLSGYQETSSPAKREPHRFFIVQRSRQGCYPYRSVCYQCLLRQRWIQSIDFSHGDVPIRVEALNRDLV